MSENETKNLSEEVKTEEAEVINTRAVLGEEDDDDKKSSATIRIALHTIIIAILLFGILNILPKTFTIPIGAGLLFLTALWTGMDCLKNGRKKQAIFTFMTCGLLAILLAIYFLLQTDLIK